MDRERIWSQIKKFFSQPVELRFSSQHFITRPANVKKLWEPFVKGDESRANKKGTGVGLSIARNIMSNTGFKGKIEVSENTFRVVVRKKKLL